MPPHAILPMTAACCIAFAGLTSAQAPVDLRQAMQERLESVWRKDATTWSRLTADEFTVVVPEGRLQTKADRIAALKVEQPQRIHDVQREEIHVYGDTAVHRFVDDGEWVLEVWARQGNAWRVVAAQVNLVKP
jgi:GGDEF domain-containing protein